METTVHYPHSIPSSFDASSDTNVLLMDAPGGAEYDDEGSGATSGYGDVVGPDDDELDDADIDVDDDLDPDLNDDDIDDDLDDDL